MAKTDPAKAAAILAAYKETRNKSEVARRFGMPRSTVREIIKRVQRTPIEEKIEAARQKATEDVIEHFAAQGELINKLMDQYILALMDEDKIARATPAQLSTAMGTVMDKYLLVKSLQTAEKEGKTGGVIMMPEIKRGP